MNKNTKDWLYEEFVVWMAYRLATCSSWTGGPIDTPWDQRIVSDEGNEAFEGAFEILEQLRVTNSVAGKHSFKVKEAELRITIREMMHHGPSFERLFSRLLWLDDCFMSPRCFFNSQRGGLLRFERDTIHVKDALIELGYVFSIQDDYHGGIFANAWTIEIEPIWREADYFHENEATLTEKALSDWNSLDDNDASIIQNFKRDGQIGLAIRRFRSVAETQFSIAKFAIENLA